MKLTVPTDFDILDALSDGRRNTAVNISYILDKNRSYINTRLPVLEDYGLVKRVGPAPNSGLYEITEKGRIAVRNRDQYRTEGVDFEELLVDELESDTRDDFENDESFASEDNERERADDT